MHVWHPLRLGAFEEHDRPMRTSSERRRLWKESAVQERGREIRVRLPFDDHAAVDDVITDGELCQTHLEVRACSDEIEYSGVSFGRVDPNPVRPRRCPVHRRVGDDASRVVAINRRDFDWRGSQKSAIG
jgi:hypothetical protein